MVRSRALIACKLIWDAMDEFGPVLERAGVDWDIPSIPGQQLSEDELLAIIEPYDGVLAGDDHLTAAVLTSAPRLRVISKWGIGVDAIDHEAARERGIRVFNTPGVFEAELAEYAFGFILMLARRQHDVDQGVRRGEWTKIRGVTLSGKTLGIVGFGSSGRALAKRALAFGMEVSAFDVDPARVAAAGPEVEACALDELLARSDIVSLHMNLTNDNHHLFNTQRIALMKPGAWLINTSRGPLIEEDALVEALTHGNIAAAALDVFEVEPLDTSSRLTALPHVILGSHNGSNTQEAVARTNALAIRNLLKGLERL